MWRIVSVFSLVLAFVCMGCVTESERSLPLDPTPVAIRKHFQIEAGENLLDSLHPLFPNPFNRAAGDTTVSIRFTIEDSTRVLVLIQNPIGEEVVRFQDDTLSPGQYTANWQPLSSEREPLNSGIYFVTFRTQGYIVSRMLSIQSN